MRNGKSIREKSETTAMKAVKCVNCRERMLTSYMRSGLAVYLCPHAKMNSLDKSSGAIYCDTQPKPMEKNVRLFKEQLKSRLTKKPLPKEDYKRIEKEIKKLEQADVNDVLYTLKNEEKGLKKQIETILKEHIDVNRQVEDAYELYTLAFILQKFAEKVGLEIDLPKDSKESMKW